MTLQVLDHGAKRKRHQVRRVIAGHFVAAQTAKDEKAKGSALSTDEKRKIRERCLESLERRDYFKDH